MTAPERKFTRLMAALSGEVLLTRMMGFRRSPHAASAHLRHDVLHFIRLLDPGEAARRTALACLPQALLIHLRRDATCCA